MPIETQKAGPEKSNKTLAFTGIAVTVLLLAVIPVSFVFPIDLGDAHGIYLGRLGHRMKPTNCDYTGPRTMMLLLARQEGIFQGVDQDICSGVLIHRTCCMLRGVRWECDWW